ncbi:hypothetical protein Tco_0029741, partial [Tanacetum coccineum]
MEPPPLATTAGSSSTTAGSSSTTAGSSSTTTAAAVATSVTHHRSSSSNHRHHSSNHRRHSNSTSTRVGRELGSMLRLETGNRSLRKAFRENNEQPLKIGFDYEDL